MNKILLIIAFIAGTVSFSMAQQQGQAGGQHQTPEQRSDAYLKRLKTPLTLDAAQEAKIKAILIAQNTSMDSVRTAAGENPDKKAMMKAMKPFREGGNKKIMDVLTAEQKTAFTTMLEQKPQGGRGQGGAPKPGQ